MAQARAVINIDVNTSAAAAQLRILQNQVNAFSATLSKNNLIQAEAAQRFSNTLMDAVSSTRFFTAEQVKMETAARRLDQTLSKGKGTLGQYFSARFRKDSAEAAAVLSLANSRAQALQTTFYETTAAARGFRDVIAVRPLAAFNTEAAVANERLAIHRAMLRQATTSMINFGKNTQWAGRQLMVGFTVPLAIFGGAAAKTFKEIEQASVRFKKVYGDAFTPPAEIEANMRAIEALALEYTKYGIAVKDTISLAAEAAAAGAQNADLLAATTEATRLATLGQMEQNEALSATIALQNAFRLSSTQLATEVNFLNMVENQTVVTLQDLADAIPRVAPVIVGLGGDVRDMAAFMAAMQEGGVSAAQGANALKSGLGSLINPTKKANDTLAQMGINLNAIVQANRGDLMATVQAFGQALSTLDQFSRQQALEEVFGKYQYARLGALFDNIIKDGTQASRVLQIAGMSAEQMASSAEKELKVISEATSTKYMAAIERFKMAIAPIGELFMKVSTPIINFFSKLFEMFDKLPDGVKNFTALATVIVGVVVPAGTMFLGLLMNLVGTLIKFSSVVASAVKGFGQGGFAGAIQAVSQSLKYMSLEEMDAATAAQQLGVATRNANTALISQITSADKATAAFTELAAAIQLAAAAQAQYAQLYPSTFIPGSSAAQEAERGAPRVRRRNKGGPIFLNEGNTVPGTGNKDTVPAMLTPGEFVVNKQATQDNLPLLHAINSGAQVPGFNKGGGIAKSGKMFYGMKIPPKALDIDLENIPEVMRARLLELRGGRSTTGSLATQSSVTAQDFITLPQLTAAQRDQLSAALETATPRLQGVNPIQLLSNLIGASPRRINARARFGQASKEEMSFLSSLTEFYLPAFSSVPSAKAALQALKLSPTEAANRLSSTLGPRFLARPGMRLSDSQIYDEVAKGFEQAGLSSVYSALLNDRNAIRYTLPTEITNELRKIMPTGMGNANVHEQLLTRAFGPQSVTNFRDSRGRPGYVVKGSQLGLSKDLLLMPGQTYPTGTGMSYEDIPVNSVQRMLQDLFIRRGYSVSDSDIQRMHLGMNKGGMIPGVQYFGGRNPGGIAQKARAILGGFRTTGDKRTSTPSQFAEIGTSYSNQYKKDAENYLKKRIPGWYKIPKKIRDEMLQGDVSHKIFRESKSQKLWYEPELFGAFGAENRSLEYLLGFDKTNNRKLFKEAQKSNLNKSELRYMNKFLNGVHPTNDNEIKVFLKMLDNLQTYISKNKEDSLVKKYVTGQTHKNKWDQALYHILSARLEGKFGGTQNIPIKTDMSKVKPINRNSGGLIPGVQYLAGAGIVRRPDMKAITSALVQRRAEVSVAKGKSLTDLIFSKGKDGKLDLDPSDLFTLLKSNRHITDEQIAQIAKYHGARIRGGIFGKFDPEVGYKVRDPKQQTWRDIAQLLKERGYPVLQERNKGGLIDGIQYLAGGGPAVGATLRRILSARQAKILAAEPEQTLESAARAYADYGYSRLTPAQRVLLSQSREPFPGPQLFRGTGASSPLIDPKLRNVLANGSYSDVINLEGEMIKFPKGSWSTDERIAYDHMKYFASENQEWESALDALTVRGSVPIYGSTYKEHIKGEQANVITRIKELKSQLKRAQDKISPEVVAQEEAKLEQLKLAVEQERKNVMSKFGFAEDQPLSLIERAFIRGEVDKSKAQAEYKSAQQSHKFNLEHPSKIQQQIDEQILSLYYKRDKRKRAFAELERLRQEGANVQVFFKATKSDRYIPPNEAKINYIQDLTKGDPNDPLVTKRYVIGLDMGYPEMVDISHGPGARYGGKTNEYEYIRQNKGGLIPVQHFNTGGVADPIKAFATGNVFESANKTIVPGVGNTDTVPAALTPGEFVINKKATAANLPLLHAINNGETPGYVTGGEVRPWGGNQYIGPGWHVYDAANEKIRDPQTGKAIVFQTKEEADAALKKYQDRVAERFKSLSGGKDISGQNDKLYPGKIEQDRNSPGNERFSKWVVYDDDGKEISRHQTLEQAKEGLAKFRQDSRKGLLASAKIPLTGKQKATMLVSTLGIAALSGVLGAIMATRGKDDNFFGQSNINVDQTEPSKWTYLNSGAQVPGMGNKDTVPAMLTPGEFVVNKDATSQNLSLLQAINGGEIPKYGVGGMIGGMAAQMAVGTAGYMGGSALGGAMGGDSGAMVGGILGSIIPSLLLPAKFGGLLGAGGIGGGALAGGLSAVLLNPLTGPIAALAAAVIATTYTFYKLSESNQKEFEAGRRLADAMTTSASEIDALGTSARKRAENTEAYLRQEEDDFIEAKYNRKIAKAKTEAEKNRLRSEKELAMELAGGKTTVRENIDTFYKEQIARSKRADQVPSYLPITNAEKAAQPQTSELYSVRNRMLGLRFAKAGPEARDSAYGQSFIQGAGKEVLDSVKAMRDLPNQFAKGELSSAQYQAVLDTGKAAYGQNVNIRQISEKDLAAKLSQYILSGVMTQDQASSVAAAIGKEIKDSGFGERVANEVITVVGAEGAIAKYNPGQVAQRLTEQNQRRVDEYQKRIEKTMPQFFAPDTMGSKATGIHGAAAAIGGIGGLGLFTTQAAMDIQRTQARDEFLTKNATPSMREMANWRETFFTSFFSGMADQLRRDMGGFLEASVANLQMLEENISVIQVRYNDLISKATTIQEKDRLRYEQANQMADLESKRIKAQEQIFAPFGGRQSYTQQVMQTTNDQQQTFGYRHNVGLDIFRGRLGAAQAAPVGINDIGGSIANVGSVIANAFIVGGANVNQAIINAFGKAGSWLNKTGFGEGLTFGEIYATQTAEAFNKKFEGAQLGINVDSLSQVLTDLGMVTEDNMDSQLFFIRQMGMQNEEVATKFTGMLVQAMAEIEAATQEKRPGEFQLSEMQARAAQEKVGSVLTSGALPGGQQLNMETLSDISTAMPALGTQNLLSFIDQMNMLGATAPQTTERLAAAFAQMGDAIKVTTTTGQSMFSMLMNNKKLLEDDTFYENAIIGSRHFAEQTEDTRSALAKFISGPESFAAFGKAIKEANPKKFNRDLNLLESSLRKTTKGLTIPKENKKDWKYVLDTFSRIDKIKDPNIRAKLEGEIEPEIFTMLALLDQLKTAEGADKQIIIDQVISLNKSIQTKVTGAEQDQKTKVSTGTGSGGAKPDPLGEQMRMLRDQINNQAGIGQNIEATGEKAFGTFDRLRQKLGKAAKLGIGESLIDYFKSLDPKTALEVGKEVLKNQGKLNTLLSLMSQNALTAQMEQTKSAKNRMKFTKLTVNASAFNQIPTYFTSQAFADEEFMQSLQQATLGANPKKANKIAEQMMKEYQAQQVAEIQRNAILAPSQLQLQSQTNRIGYRGAQQLQSEMGLSQEDLQIAMQNEQVQKIMLDAQRTGRQLSQEERDSVTSFLNSQKTLQGELNKVFDEVNEKLQGVNQVLSDSIQYIELYSIKPLQDQLDSLQEKNSEYSEQSRRLSHALSQLQEKIRVESEKIQEKEKEVNEVYNNRISSLDKISRINQKIADQQRGQLDLASALSRGDIAGAAQAALSMQQNYAQSQQEDARAALTEQRDSELKALQEERDNLKNMTIEYNGELLTTEQIQSRIDDLNEKIYQNSLLEWDIQKKITAEKDKQQKIADQQAKVDRTINVIEKLKIAANEDPGKRAEEIASTISAAILANTPSSNAFADFLTQNQNQLLNLSPEDFSLFISDAFSQFISGASGELGQDLSGLQNILPTNKPGVSADQSNPLQAIFDENKTVIDTLSTKLVDLNEYMKKDPFKETKIAHEKYVSAINGIFSKIPKEPGSGGGGGTPETPPLDRRIPQEEIKIPEPSNAEGVVNTGYNAYQAYNTPNIFDQLTAQANNFIAWFKQSIPQPITDTVKTLTETVAAFFVALQELFVEIVITPIKNKFNSFYAENIQPLINKLILGFEQAKSFIITKIDAIIDKFTPAIDTIKEGLKKLYDERVKPIIDGVKDVWKAFSDAFTTAKDAITTGWDEWSNKTFREKIDAFKSTLKSIFDPETWKSWIVALGGPIGQAFNGIAQAIANAFKIKITVPNNPIFGPLAGKEFTLGVSAGGTGTTNAGGTGTTPTGAPGAGQAPPPVDGSEGPKRKSASKSPVINNNEQEKDPATTLLSDFEEQMTTLADYANKFLSADTGLPYILSSLLAGMVETVNGFFEHVKNVLNAITITIPPVKLSFAASGTGQDSKGNSVSWSVSGSGSTKEASTKISPLVTSIASMEKKAFGGMINYKGSKESAPGMMFGGRMKKFAMGSFVPGIGSTDKVPALLTPGEFVVRKPVAQEIAPLLNAVNSNVFPKMNLGGVIPKPAGTSDSSVQYNYNVEVNVAGTNASPDDIANAVISKINTVNDRQIRSIKINGNG